MVSGLSVWLEFKDAEAKERFVAWMSRGNVKSEGLGVGSLGLRAKMKLVNGRYLFAYEHDFFINMALFLRVALWVQLWRLRGRVVIRTARKPDVVNSFFGGC